MATERKTANVVTEEIEETQKELNLDTKVTVKNIAAWKVGFARRADGYGDISISPGGSVRLSRNEIISQVQNGNKLFTGTDGLGSHATLYINDAPTRVEVGFEEAKGAKQLIFTNIDVKKLFAIGTQDKFEEEFKRFIYTRAEKFAIIEAMKKEKVNDYSKIRFVEEYTGYKYQ